MKKTNIMKASAIVATAIMTAAAGGVTASAKSAAPMRTVKRTKKNDVVSVETLEFSDAQAVAGKTVAVQMEMETGNTCFAYEVIVEYDPALQLERVIGAQAYDTLDNYIALVGYGSSAFVDNKPVVTLNFKVPDNAEIGDTYEVKFSEVRSFSALEDEYENYELKNSTIEILEETKRFTDYMMFQKKDESGNVVETKPGLRGDANGDGKVSAMDAALIAKDCANAAFSDQRIIDSEENRFFANVRGKEGSDITAKDAALIAKYVSSNGLQSTDWEEVIG